jgi:ABC-type lipoprotein release transport system permease subunit
MFKIQFRFLVYTPTDSNGTSGTNIGLIIGIVIGVLVLIVIVAVLLYCYKSKDSKLFSFNLLNL